MNRSFIKAVYGLFFICLLWFPLCAYSQSIAYQKPLSIIPESIHDILPVQQRRDAKIYHKLNLPAFVPNSINTRFQARSVRARISRKGLVRVGQLGRLEEGNVGLIKGFGASLWQTSYLSKINQLLSQLPPNFYLPSLRQWAKDAMRTKAFPPSRISNGAKNVEGALFFTQRLRHLLQWGDINSVKTMIRNTNADKSNINITKLSTDIHLIEADYMAACQKLRQLNHLSSVSDPSLFTLKIHAFCQTRVGDQQAANLTMGIIEDLGQEESLYIDILFALLTDTVPQLRNNQNMWSILETIMIEESKMIPSIIELEQFPYSLLPHFAENNKYDIVTQFVATEKAIFYDILPADHIVVKAEFFDLPLEVGNDSDEMPYQRVHEKQQAIKRANLLRSITDSVTLAGRLSALRDLLYNANQQNLWAVYVKVIAPILYRIEPSVERASFAEVAVPAFLWLNDPEQAQKWINALSTYQEGLPSVLLRNLTSLMRFSSAEIIQSPPLESTWMPLASSLTSKKLKTLPSSEVSLMGVMNQTGTDKQKIYTDYEVYLLPIFDYHIPKFLYEKNSNPSSKTPMYKQIKAIQKSAAKGRYGEVLLHGLKILSVNQKVTDYHLKDIQNVLLALKSSGFETEARHIAREFMILQMVDLLQDET